MAVSGEYLTYILDVMAQAAVRQVTARRMFGGVGLYSQGLFFAILADDTLYLKGDARTRDDYRRDGAEPFAYVRKGQLRSMDYWSVSAEILEEPEALGRWVGLALEAAARAKG